MKSLKLGIAALSLVCLATGCSNGYDVDEILSAETKKLDFSLYLGKQTKASEFANEELKALDGTDGNLPKVETYVQNTSSDFLKLYDVYLKHSGGNWLTYGDENGSNLAEFFIPMDKKLHFYSTLPSKSSNISNKNLNNSLYTFTYRIAEEANNQEDLLFAYAERDFTENYKDNKVSLTYGHLLSQVNFSVKSENKMDISVNSIELKCNDGISDVGYFIFNSTSEPANSFLWNLIGNSHLTHNYLDTEVLVNNNPVGEIKSLNNGKNALMLLPQEVNASNIATGSKATVLIKYALEFNGIEYVDNSVNGVEIELPNIVWEAGKKYNYVFDLTSDLSKLDLSLDVKEWETESDQELK